MELPDLKQQPESVPVWLKARNLWAKNEKYLTAEFFVAGFLFDILTLKRIDEWLTIVQQGVFLLLAVFLLVLKTKDGTHRRHGRNSCTRAGGTGLKPCTSFLVAS